MTSARFFLLSLAVGCSDAQYADPADARVRANQDGRVEDAGPLWDARATPDSAARPWHASLANHYAIVSRFYSKDRGLADQALFSHEIFTLAQISIDGDRVTMETTRCVDRGTVIAFGVKDEFTWANPQALPAQSFELVMRPEGLRTEAPATPIGYRPGQPQGCVDGQMVKVEDRPWLPNGMCECHDDLHPLWPNDCRVVDDDGDMRPGVTVQHKGVLNDPENMRTLDGCQISHGQLSADKGIRGYFVQNYESLPLGCGASPCPRAELAPCPLELNPVTFYPLADGSWDCEKMLAEQAAGRLWTLPPLVFVDGC